MEAPPNGQDVAATHASITSLLSQHSTLTRVHHRQQMQPESERTFRPVCPNVTLTECNRRAGGSTTCTKLHFEVLNLPQTDLSLGDCSYLNDCHRMNTCRYVHYIMVDNLEFDLQQRLPVPNKARLAMTPSPMWIQADVRTIDLASLGTFGVVLLDPPWLIHQALPYGCLLDEEMQRLKIGSLQRAGDYLFMWVTGRATDVAKLCLEEWGYDQVEEIVWVKTNQLQRIIRTGRTGHWLNHSKEHCIVARRRHDAEAPPRIGLEPAFPRIESNVIVAEVRETSRKPDEIYTLIERMFPYERKIEIFGRDHNKRSGWQVENTAHLLLTILMLASIKVDVGKSADRGLFASSPVFPVMIVESGFGLLGQRTFQMDQKQ